MSRSLTIPGNKRKRPDSDPPGLSDPDRAVLNVIKSKRDLGMWQRDIKIETKLAENVVKKSINSLMSRNLIKEVVNHQNKIKKHYMAVEFEPSKEITGGDWYTKGSLDKELIDTVKQVCLKYLSVNKVATLEGVHNYFQRVRVLTFDITSQQVGEILDSMVWDNDVVEVKSTGMGDYGLIPVGTVCYRVTKGVRTGAFASIPCGACPRISMCTPDGIISPSTCVYYKKWLSIDF